MEDMSFDARVSCAPGYMLRSSAAHAISNLDQLPTYALESVRLLR